MKNIFVLTAMISVLVAQAAEFKPTDLVIQPRVSYTWGPVRLTRVLEAAKSANKFETTSSETKSEGANEKMSVGAISEAGSSSRSSLGYSIGGSIGGSSGGSGGFSLLGLMGINYEIGGKFSSEDSKTSSSSYRNSSEVSSERSHQNSSGSSSEFAEVEQYGSYHLKFTVVFKSNDQNDTFLVGGPNAHVILNGFRSPVRVPYLERQEPVRLQAVEQTFFFDYPIADQLTLEDAKRFDKEGRLNAVTLKLIGDEFPVVSERTKTNVMSEFARMMEKSPSTVISVDFGDVKRLSPWHVKQKYPKASGRRGQRVTVREALDALNDVIAEDDEMPEKAFAFASSGEMKTVCDTSVVGAPGKGNLFLVAVSTVANTKDAEIEVHLPTASFLSRSLSDFVKLHLFQLPLRRVARARVECPEMVSVIVNEIEEAIKEVKGGNELWTSLCKQYEKEKLIQKEGDHRIGSEMTIDLPGGVKMVFCWCPAGEFLMGSPSSESWRYDSELQHRVKITKGFWMAKTEVTQEQWRSVMGNNPSFFSGLNLPVEQVSWDDCQAFVQRVRTKSGLDVRLPTEAEWEYACRAGSTGAYFGALDEVAWYGKNSGKATHPVGSKAPNAWGLYDMSGNVWEWCQDRYGGGYYASSAAEDPHGPASGVLRVIRGGSWYYTARNCRSADRGRGLPVFRDNGLGFRVACSAGPSK